MATQVITITLTDDGSGNLCSPVKCKIDLKTECISGSNSYLTALALKCNFPDIMKSVGEEISQRMTEVIRKKRTH